MPRDSSGNYTLPLGNPVIDGTVIDVNWANPTMNDIAVQLNNVVTRDGLLGFINPAFFVDGTPALPGVAFSSQHGTGMWKDPTQLGLSYNGAPIQTWTSIGSTILGSLSIAEGAANAAFIELAQNRTVAGPAYIDFHSEPGAGDFDARIIKLPVSSDNALSIINVLGPLTFITNSTERMRIDAAGNVLIGQTAPTVSAPGRGLIELKGSTEAVIQMNKGATPGLQIYTGPTFAAINSYGTSLSLFAGGLEALVIEPVNGNVGIGTDAPVSRMHVYGGDTTTSPDRSQFRADVSGADTDFGVGRGANIQLGNTTSNRYFAIQQVDANLQFFNFNGSAWAERMRIDAAGNVDIGWAGATPFGAVPLAVNGQIKVFARGSDTLFRFLSNDFTSGASVFITPNTGAGFTIGTDFASLNLAVGGVVGFQLGSDLNVYMGNNSGVAKSLNISGTGRPSIRFTNSSYIWTTSLKGDNPAESWYMISNPSETVGVYMTPVASGWVNMSDERFKTDLQPILNAVNKLDTLRAVTYKIAADLTLPRDVGLIAQDVQAVLPEAVDASNPERLGMRYHTVVPLLVAAIKELQARLVLAGI